MRFRHFALAALLSFSRLTLAIGPTPTPTWTPDPRPQFLYVAVKSSSAIAKYSYPSMQLQGYVNLSLSNNSPISAVHGMTRDSQGKYWLLVQTANSRVLATVDMSSGLVVPVSSASQFATSLAIDDAGNVYTVLGGEAQNHQFWLGQMDSQGTITPLAFDGIAEGGHGLAFDYDQHRLLHASGNNMKQLEYYDLPISAGANDILINTYNSAPSRVNSICYAGQGRFIFGLSGQVYGSDAIGNLDSQPLLSGLSDVVMGLVLGTDDFALALPPAASPGQSLYFVPNNGTTLQQLSLPSLALANSLSLSLSYNAESLNSVYAMASDPSTGTFWIAGTSSGTFNGSNYFLGKLDPATGIIGSVSGTGEAINSLVFKPNGQLYATTTNNGTDQESVIVRNADSTWAQVLSGTAAPSPWGSNYLAMAYDSGDSHFYVAMGSWWNAFFRLGASPAPSNIEKVYGMSNGVLGTTYNLCYYQPGWMMASFSSYIVALSQTGEHRLLGQLSSSNGPFVIAGPLALLTPTPSDTNTPTAVPTLTFTPTPTTTGTPLASVSGQRFYGADQGAPYIHEFNPATGLDTRRLALNTLDPSLRPLSGCRALAHDPVGGLYYVGIDTNSGRHLMTVNMGNGELSDVGTVGGLAALAFDSAGNLYAAEGSTGSFAGQVVTLDKTNGTETAFVNMGTGDGLALAFRQQDGQIYEPSGNNYDRLSAISITAGTYTDLTNSVSNALGAVRAAAVLSDGNILVSDGNGQNIVLSNVDGAVLGAYSNFNGYTIKGLIVSSPIAGFAASPLYTPTPVAQPTISASSVLVGAMAYSPDLVTIDPATGLELSRILVTGVSGLNQFMGLAYDSTGSKLYAIAGINGNSTRDLVSINLLTGVATDIGTTGAYVAGLACDASGQLYGLQGSSSNTFAQGGLSAIDKTTGALSTTVVASVSPYDGVSLAFDSDDSKLYAALGDSFNKMAQIDPASSFSVNYSSAQKLGTDIAQGSTSLVYIGAGTFLFGDRNGQLRYMLANGSYYSSVKIHAPFNNSSDTMKGLALVPAAAVPTAVPTATTMPTPSGKSLLVLRSQSNTLYKLSLSDFSIQASYPIAVAGHSFSFGEGLAQDPSGSLYYMVMSEANNSVRGLLTFDAASGAVSYVGDLGLFISGLAFDSTGQLYGVVGNNSSPGGALVSISKTTAALGTPVNWSGSSGLALAYNPLDNSMYKAWNDNPGSWQSYDLGAQTFGSVQNFGVSDGNNPGSLTYYQGGFFLMTRYNSLYTVNSAGQASAIGHLPWNENIKGLALVASGPFPTATITPTRTSTPQFTPTPTQTAAFLGTNQGHTVAGPVPAKRSDPICLGFPAAPISSVWDVYNTGGQKTAHLSFGSEAEQCWGHPNVAPGFYFLHLKVKTANGDEERIQKIVILP